MYIEIHGVSADAFLLFDHIEIPLHAQGKVFLTASRDYDNAASNGGGKTSAISLLYWILYGGLFGDAADVTSVIQDGAKQCTGTATGILHEGPSQYPFTVTRTRTRRGGQVMADFAGASRSADVQSEIGRIFGSPEAAMNTVFMAAGKAAEFASTTDGQRRKRMEEMLHLDRWQQPLMAVKEAIRWEREALSRLGHEVTELTLRLQGVEDKAKFDKELALSRISAGMERVTADLAWLEPMAVEKQKLACVLREQLAALSADLDKACALEAVVREEASRAHMECNRAYTRHRTAENAGGGVCPVCRRSLDEAPTPADELQALADDLAIAEGAYRISNAALKTATCSVAAERIALAEGRRRVTECDKDLAVAEHRIRECLEESERLREQASAIAAADDHAAADEARDLRGRISRRNAMLETVGRSLQYMEECRIAYGPSGIPAMIMASALPLLNQYTNELLAVLTDGMLSHEVVLGDLGRSSDALLDRMAFVLSDEGTERYLGRGSAGQIRCVTIAMFMAFAMIQEELAGVSWNVRFIDELFEGLDANRIVNVGRMLSHPRIAAIPTVIVTSHRTELADMDVFDRRWKVVRGVHKSQLIVT